MSNDLDWLARNVHEWLDYRTYAVVVNDKVYWDSGSALGETFTKDQWQARRAELGLDAPEWTGPKDGLPPVGVECEVEWNENVWIACSVLLVTDYSVIVHIPEMHQDHCIRRDQRCIFRPIRTEEDKAVEEMCDALEGIDNATANNAALVALYRAGYRKLDTQTENE